MSNLKVERLPGDLYSVYSSMNISWEYHGHYVHEFAVAVELMRYDVYMPGYNESYVLPWQEGFPRGSNYDRLKVG